VNTIINVFEVRTAVIMKVAILWDLAPCSPYINQGFGGKYHLHFQGRKSSEPSYLLARWFLAQLIFCPEGAGNNFLRN
jgi:hypothetical protein